LVETNSRAAQEPVHDVMDSTAIRSWLNNPLTRSLEQDIYKATNILKDVQRVNRLVKDIIPEAVLSNAAGFALLSQLKVGLGLWSCRVGTGLVVARRPGGEWSDPCAVSCCGAGWGPQAGGELMDVILVLPTWEAVNAFSGRAQLVVGGSVSLAIGVGVARIAEASLKVGDGGGTARCYSYGISRGAFAGMSIEGAVISTRDDVNMNFYGQQVSPKELLLQGSPIQPPAAKMLYEALDAVASTSVKAMEASLQGESVADLRSPVQLVESISADSPHREVSTRAQVAFAESTPSDAVDVNNRSFSTAALAMQGRHSQGLRFEVGTGLQYVEQDYSEEDVEEPLPMLPCL